MRVLVLHTGKPLFDQARRTLGGDIEYVDLVAGSDAAPRVVASFTPELPTLDRVDSLMASIPFDRVVSTSESNVAFAAYLRTRYGLPGLHADAAEVVTNKYRMKQYLADRVPVVPFCLSGPFLAGAGKDLGDVVILKPLIGSGGRDMQVLPADAARETLRRTKRLMLVERAVDIVNEYHCDGVVRDGVVRWCLTSRYFGPLFRSVGDHNGSLHLPPYDPRSTAVAALTERVVRGLGLPDFAFHLEALDLGGDLMLGEIGLRPAGGGIAQSVLRFHEVDLWYEHLCAELGLATEHSRHGPRGAVVTSWQGVIGVSGFRRSPTDAELLALDGVVAVSAGRLQIDEAIRVRSTGAFSKLAFIDATSEEAARGAFASVQLDAEI